MTEFKKKRPEKYVVVLAHADGWGALSANKVIRHLHEHYPDLGVHLIVSKATRNKAGKIATKIDDLKTPREIKEENLLKYFDQIDGMYERMFPYPKDEQIKGLKPVDESAYRGLAPADQFGRLYETGLEGGLRSHASLLTFKELAKRYCTDGTVHYTSKGGPDGGKEVARAVKQIGHRHYKDHGPEVLLSVDTMAILPKELLEKYHCFSTHPGPLDTIKIEGMQGTVRSLTNQVLYDQDGVPLPKDHIFGRGMAYIKGTLFMQHPELDKGPPIRTTLSPVCPGMCAYQARDEVYHMLTDEMLDLLPTFLDRKKRFNLVADATKAKKALDAQPHQRIPDLEAEPFARWQGKAVPIWDESSPHGVGALQNEIINPSYFQNQMRRFYPGPDVDFEKKFNEIYGSALDKLADQKDERLIHSNPRLAALSGVPGITYRRYDPKTQEVIEEIKNPPRTR